MHVHRQQNAGNHGAIDQRFQWPPVYKSQGPQQRCHAHSETNNKDKQLLLDIDSEVEIGSNLAHKKEKINKDKQLLLDIDSEVEIGSILAQILKCQTKLNHYTKLNHTPTQVWPYANSQKSVPTYIQHIKLKV